MKPFRFNSNILLLAGTLFGVFGTTLYPNSAKAQVQLTWPVKQQKYYVLLNEFCHFLENNPRNITNQQYIFHHYVDYPPLYTDTLNKKNAERLTAFGILLAHFKTFIDSVGLDNLDAKPAQFWKHDSLAFAPFLHGLDEHPANCLGYFAKSSPNKPIGYILFDPKSEKLVSWFLINQGGTYYFFKFTML